MITKTKYLDNKLSNDIYLLNINRNNPVKILGSYNQKEFGDVITDIDLSSFVRYNNKLLDILYSVINRIDKNDKFMFNSLNMGIQEDFIAPWIFKEDGNCIFNYDKVLKWFDKFRRKKLISEKDLNTIEDILYREEINIVDILYIESLLQKYGSISWSLNDIKNQYKVINGKRYTLLDTMKKYIPIIKLVYVYRGKFIPIDYALTDKKYSSSQSRRNNIFTNYYIENYYKMLKYLRWKIDDRYRDEYNRKLKQVEIFVSLVYQINMLRNLTDNKIISKNTSNKYYYDNIIPTLQKYKIPYKPINLTVTKLKERINNTIRDDFYYFQDKVKPKFINDLRLKEDRVLRSKENVSTDVLIKRGDIEIQCPFFKTDIDQYIYISNIANRLQMNISKLIDCLYNTAIEQNKTLDEIIDDINPRNNLSIQIDDGYIFLMDGNKFVDKYISNANNIQKLQLYILTNTRY